MRIPIRILIIEDNRELCKKIANLIQERFGIECVIIQRNEEHFEHSIENCIGRMSGLDLFQSLIDESFRCSIPANFDLIIRNACVPDSIAISEPYRVPPRKFAGVRNNPIPKRCRNAKRKSWY